MNEQLYADIKAQVVAALTVADDRTTLAQARHIAHDTTYAVMQLVADEVRELGDVSLETVLFELGQRP